MQTNQVFLYTTCRQLLFALYSFPQNFALIFVRPMHKQASYKHRVQLQILLTVLKGK